MSNAKSLLLQLCPVLVLLAGCAQQQQYEAVEPICVQDMNMADVMQIAEDVLAKMHFTIEKADLKSGLVRTRPLPGAQFFEFWRSDNVGAFNCAEANLHSIRRIVELHINQQGKKLCIDCDVKVQRLSLPERQVGSSALAYRMFSQSTPSMQKLKFDPEQKAAMAWIDLDRDAMLATEILKRIEKQIRNLKSEARSNIKIQMSK